MAKRALLVGINRYRIPGADLRGCVNDVKNLKSVLTRYYGFADKDIRRSRICRRPRKPCNQGSPS